MRRQPSQTRQNAGRWCSRALLVLGGAIAGTAAAWALSTSAASASTAEEPGSTGDVQRVAESAVAGLDDLSSGVSDLVGAGTQAPDQQGGHPTNRDESQDGAEQAPSEQPAQPAGDAEAQGGESTGTRTGELRAAVTTFTDNAVLRPAGRTLRAVLHLLSQPEDAPDMIRQALTPPEQVREFGQQVWEFFQPGEGSQPLPLPQLPPVSGDSGAGYVPGVAAHASPLTHLAGGDADAQRQLADAVHHDLTAGTAEQRGGTAPLSPVSLPFAPLALPSVPSGAATGGHVDSPQFGYPAASLSAFDPTAIGSVRSGVRYLLLQPESQPGVTPD